MIKNNWYKCFKCKKMDQQICIFMFSELKEESIYYSKMYGFNEDGTITKDIKSTHCGYHKNKIRKATNEEMSKILSEEI